MRISEALQPKQERFLRLTFTVPRKVALKNLRKNYVPIYSNLSPYRNLNEISNLFENYLSLRTNSTNLYLWFKINIRKGTTVFMNILNNWKYSDELSRYQIYVVQKAYIHKYVVFAQFSCKILLNWIAK